MTKNATKNEVAHGGTVHPIAKAPLKLGKRFGDVFLSPGLDRDWEGGYHCPETNEWYRHDGAKLKPTHWCPAPGETVKLTS